MSEVECWVCGETFGRLPLHMRVHDEKEIREALLSELRRVAEEIGRTPTTRIMDDPEIDSPSSDPYKQRFGSFNGALREAGLEPNMEGSWGVSDATLLEEVERLSEELGHAPRQDDMDERGTFASKTLEDRFGSWSEALLAADVDVSDRGIVVSERVLIESLRDLGEEIGRAPSANEVREHGEYALTTYHRRFESWIAALEKAGFDVHPGRPDVFPSGEDHPAWEGGSFDYGPGWNAAKRRAVRDRDGRKCTQCGMAEKEHLDKHGTVLHVHHIVKARKFDDDEAEKRNAMVNLTTLCLGCHSSTHKGETVVPTLSQ
ncbi:homing endonuclease associated repeat-containing protein [Halorhabdus rudnickae]|uniref:homing endonuclease associated repeat-containing protein n=1 Tax=Halorhabdus rudnickae TaxID=1775544 RepID=UPI0010835104|nr:HNH endonuclease [Halorhabdus rudnickae]